MDIKPFKWATSCVLVLSSIRSKVVPSFKWGIYTKDDMMRVHVRRLRCHFTTVEDHNKQDSSCLLSLYQERYNLKIWILIEHLRYRVSLWGLCDLISLTWCGFIVAIAVYWVDIPNRCVTDLSASACIMGVYEVICYSRWTAPSNPIENFKVKPLKVKRYIKKDAASTKAKQVGFQAKEEYQTHLWIFTQKVLWVAGLWTLRNNRSLSVAYKQLICRVEGKLQCIIRKFVRLMYLIHILK